MNKYTEPDRILQSDRPVLLVGGGDVRADRLASLAQGGERLVAADGGADHLVAAGLLPDAVIGDMDSISAKTRAALPQGVLHVIEEQDSTDFDKCLRHISAPLVLGYGFLGGRLDHQLAAMTVLARYPERRCILVGEADLVLLCPPDLTLDLPLGSRLSLFPLGTVTGRSEGLRWAIDGLSFRPDLRVGTSNEVSGPVRLRMDAPGMLLILPQQALSPLIASLGAAPASWSAL